MSVSAIHLSSLYIMLAIWKHLFFSIHPPSHVKYSLKLLTTFHRHTRMTISRSGTVRWFYAINQNTFTINEHMWKAYQSIGFDKHIFHDIIHIWGTTDENLFFQRRNFSIMCRSSLLVANQSLLITYET